MSMIKPRLAIAYHFFNDHDTIAGIMKGVRSTYGGPGCQGNHRAVLRRNGQVSGVEHQRKRKCSRSRPPCVGAAAPAGCLIFGEDQ